MDTRAEIIKIGDNLLREKGYNAFSFYDISHKLNIKNASIHYHFPTKTSLGIAIVHEGMNRLEQLRKKTKDKDPIEKLNAFLGIYTKAKAENKICLVGALTTDLNTVEPELQNELKRLVGNILNWVTEILREGKKKGVFHFDINERTKALMIITNMMASVQLTRLTSRRDFNQIKEMVTNDLIKN